VEEFQAVQQEPQLRVKVDKVQMPQQVDLQNMVEVEVEEKMQHLYVLPVEVLCMVPVVVVPVVVLVQVRTLIRPQEGHQELIQVEQVVRQEQQVIPQQVEVQEVREQYFSVVQVEVVVEVHHLM
jgi:hypothetical protein